MLIFWVTMVLLIGALNYAMPRLTRRDIFFSVTVAPEFRDTHKARLILANYQRGIIIVTAIALVLIVAEVRTGAELLGAGLLMLQLLAARGFRPRASADDCAQERRVQRARGIT